MKMKLIAAAVLAGAAQAALAANGQPYYGLQGTYVDGDNLRNNKEGYGATLLLGLPAGEYLAGELNLFGLRMNNDTNSFDKQLGGGLDLASIRSLARVALRPSCSSAAVRSMKIAMAPSAATPSSTRAAAFLPI